MSTKENRNFSKIVYIFYFPSYQYQRHQIMVDYCCIDCVKVGDVKDFKKLVKVSDLILNLLTLL